MINISVIGQTLTATTDSPLVEKSQGVVRFTAEFSDEWNELNKTVLFVNNTGEAYGVVGDSGLVPWEALQDAGRLYISVKGTSEDVQKPTMLSSHTWLPVYKAGAIDATEPSPAPSPSPAEQALVIAQQAKALAEQAMSLIGDAGETATWGRITGLIQQQSDLAAVFASYADEIDKKVDFAQTQSLIPTQRQQARANIKAAAGGQRRVTQDTSKIIDLTPYTSSTNHYVCPCDGYLRLRGATSGRANASVDNYTSISALNDAYNMTFVAEGAWLFVSGNPQTAQFLPIEIIDA